MVRKLFFVRVMDLKEAGGFLTKPWTNLVNWTLGQKKAVLCRGKARQLQDSSQPWVHVTKKPLWGDAAEAAEAAEAEMKREGLLSCCKKFGARRLQLTSEKQNSINRAKGICNHRFGKEREEIHALLQQFSKLSSIQAHPCCLGEEMREVGKVNSCCSIDASVHALQASLLPFRGQKQGGEIQKGK